MMRVSEHSTSPAAGPTRSNVQDDRAEKEWGGKATGKEDRAAGWKWHTVEMAVFNIL